MGALRALTERLRTEESGAGVFTSVFGLLMVLVFMFISAHVLLNLFARSTVTSLAYEAARLASAEDGSPGDGATFLQSNLGDRIVSQAIGQEGEDMVARVSAQGPSLLPLPMPGLGDLSQIDVEVRARIEQPAATGTP